jgi:hypothetical protein
VENFNEIANSLQTIAFTIIPPSKMSTPLEKKERIFSGVKNHGVFF